MEIGQQAELEAERVQMALETLLVGLGYRIEGKGSNGDPAFDDDEATFVLAQVVPVELDGDVLVIVVGDTQPSQFDHRGAAVDLVQEARAECEVDAVERFVQCSTELWV